MKAVCAAYQKIQPLTGGRNSQVFRAWQGEQSVVLKFFLGQNAAVRFEREWASYHFLQHLPQQWSPQLLAVKASSCCLVLEDIRSAKTVRQLTSEQLSRLFEFFAEVLNCPVTAKMLPAENAAANRAAFLGDIAHRIERLRQVSDQRLHRWVNWFEKGFQSLLVQQSALPEQLEIRFQRWVPADFSLQNVLFQAETNRVWVIDFEYAGRDDSARWLADWVWHPGQQLTGEQIEQIEGFFIEKLKDADKLFEQRYAFLKQACGLRWLLIMLNCFLPDYREQRPWLAKTAADWQQMEAKQLAQAEVLKRKWERYASSVAKG